MFLYTLFVFGSGIMFGFGLFFYLAYRYGRQSED